jgi:asparagine synthase (glutamine-hydrolysing)
MGFPVPFGAWVRGPWNGVVRDVLLDRRSCERGIVDPAAVDRLLRDHQAGRVDGGDHIWSLLNLELWYRTFVDRQGIQSLPAPHRASADASAPFGRPQPAMAGPDDASRPREVA